MHDLHKLSRQERVFLAGAIKALILADGKIEESELEELDHIVVKLKFDDFDSCLEQFEQEARREEGFRILAENIFHEETRRLILALLWELALQQGAARPDEVAVIKTLQSWWNS